MEDVKPEEVRLAAPRPPQKNLIAALVKVQAALAPATQDGAADLGNRKFKYATLAACWDALRKPLTDNGFAVLQQTHCDADGVTVTTRLMHVSGEEEVDHLWLPVVQKTPQGYGSAITYGARYSLQRMTGLVSDDDDGAAAGVKPPQGMEGLAEVAKPQAKKPAPSPKPTRVGPPAEWPSPIGTKIKGTPLGDLEADALKWLRGEMTKQAIATAVESVRAEAAAYAEGITAVMAAKGYV